MELSPDALRAIAAKACSIEERLSPCITPGTSPGIEALGAQRLDEWRAVATPDGDVQFQRRLEYEGLELERVRQVLGDVQLAADAPLPPWAQTLQHVLSIADETITAQAPPEDGIDNDPLPFEEIFTPFLILAEKRVRERAPEIANLFTERAGKHLQRGLLYWLSRYSVQALHLEFSISRAAPTSSFKRLLSYAAGSASRDLYHEFIEGMRAGGLFHFFQEYAVLARQLCTITDLWVDSTTELLQRLYSDAAQIAVVFAHGQPLGRVVSVESGLSDPHRGRRSVALLTFECGTKVIYKPRDVGIESAFQRFLAWINSRYRHIDLRVLIILARKEYGWVEYVEHRPCNNSEEAHLYFIRAGMLLCLVHLLEGVDCHRDNLIAEGAHPVLVDCEALLQPRQRLDTVVDVVMARHIAQEQLSRSVLHTGMLPVWQIVDEGRTKRVFDISAFGGLSSKVDEAFGMVWKKVNTDTMEIGFEPARVIIKNAGPMLNNRSLRLEDWHQDTIAGFRAMCRFLVLIRNELMAADGPLRAMALHPVRFIHRDTQVYGTLCLRLMSPEYQRDGVKRSIQLDLLYRALLPHQNTLQGEASKPRWWRIVAAERHMMQSEDIPYFEADPTSTGIALPDGTAADLFQRPSIEQVLDRLRHMDETDVERQVGFIAASVQPQHPAVSAPPESDGIQAITDDDRDPDLEHFDFGTPAFAIAEELLVRAIRTGRSATWIGPQLMHRAERYQLQTLNNDLYTGAGGVMLFLAAAGCLSDSPELRQLALDAAASIRADVDNNGTRLAEEMGIGGAVGLGSIVYSLAKTAVLTSEEALLKTAEKAAALITDETVAADTGYDVFEGSAGAILGLLALYRITQKPDVLERADLCAQHLVKAATPTAVGHRAWATTNGQFMGGFSHGVAGISYALLKLVTETRNEEYRNLAEEAILYEDSLFCPKAGNWSDLRSGLDQKLYSASWCHGAPGIALGRLGAIRVLDHPRIQHDIEAAVQLMTSLPLYAVDYLCCGNLGIDEILLVLSDVLGRKQLARLAAQRSRKVILRAHHNGKYSLDALVSDHIYNPNFFHGCAGIGYTFLRHAYPAKLPSVLAFE